MIDLRLGDCLKVMETIPDGSIDLVITSPPYNMGGVSLGYQPLSTVGQKHYGEYQDKRNDQEYVEWCMLVIKECLRVSRYVFWNVQFVRSTRDMILALQNVFKDKLKDIFIWQKQAVASITAKDGGLAKGWEYVFMLGQDNLTTFNYNNFPKNGYVPNIKTWYKKETFKEHHATFTREMCYYFIENFTKEGDTVLDPFSGTGTTLVAAKELKRKSIGIDIDPNYYKIAERRINNTTENLL